MNERIIELAEQAGFRVEIQFDMWCAYQEELERFAELVRQDYLHQLKASNRVDGSFKNKSGTWNHYEDVEHETFYRLD